MPHPQQQQQQQQQEQPSQSANSTLKYNLLSPLDNIPSAASTSRANSIHSQNSTSDQASSTRLKVKRRKLIVIGDGACGKTSLLMNFSRGTFSEAYVPTVFESEIKRVTIERRPVDLTLFDTAGQEDFDRLRPLVYPETDVILVCYAVDSPRTLQNVIDKWTDELRMYCRGVPFLLVGCKHDLPSELTREDGDRVCRQIGAAGHYRCSAKTGEGVAQVFEQACRVALAQRKHTHPQRKKRSCLLQ